MYNYTVRCSKSEALSHARPPSLSTELGTQSGLRLVVLNCALFCPPRVISHYQETFSVVKTGRQRVLLASSGRGQETAKHPTMYRTPPQQRWPCAKYHYCCREKAGARWGNKLHLIGLKPWKSLAHSLVTCSHSFPLNGHWGLLSSCM